MKPEEAMQHLMRAGIVPPSHLAPTHVAARTFCGRRDAPVSWVPVYLRAMGLLSVEPMKWPARVKPLRETAATLLEAY